MFKLTFTVEVGYWCWRLAYLKLSLSQTAGDWADLGDTTINIIYATKPFSRVKWHFRLVIVIQIADSMVYIKGIF